MNDGICCSHSFDHEGSCQIGHECQHDNNTHTQGPTRSNSQIFFLQKAGEIIAVPGERF